MPNKSEYQNIADYMKAFDRMFLFLPDEVAAEHKREIELHLRQLAQQSLLEGMTEEGAERQAIATFGPPREVAGPLVMRWLRTAESSPENTGHITSIERAPEKARRGSKILLQFVASAIPPLALIFIPTSPKSLEISLLLACGSVNGILMAFSLSVGREAELSPSMMERARQALEESPRQKPRFLENPVRWLNWQFGYWIMRRLSSGLFGKRKKPLAAINWKFFLAYGIAFLLANLLPKEGAQMFTFLLANFMATRITLALREHVLQRSQV